MPLTLSPSSMNLIPVFTPKIPPTMQEKLQRLNALVKEARRKVEIIHDQTEILKVLNIKLETLLNVIDALRTPKITYLEDKLDPIVNDDGFNDSNLHLKDSEFFNATFTRSLHIEQHSTLVEEKYTIDAIKQKVQQINANQKFIANACKVIDAINGSRDGLCLDDIMRRSGVSKYRCIEIVNELMKCVPNVLVKRYEGRNFMYELNM